MEKGIQLLKEDKSTGEPKQFSCVAIIPVKTTTIFCGVLYRPIYKSYHEKELDKDIDKFMNKREIGRRH